MTKEDVIKSLDPDTLGLFCCLIGHGMTESEAADHLYREGIIAYWERDLLKGK